MRVENLNSSIDKFNLYFDNDSAVNGSGIKTDPANSQNFTNKWTQFDGDGKVMDSWAYAVSQKNNVSIR
jgi:hypothetical protein